MAKKRANGEGNIRKRSDGRWEGRYTAGYNAETGKRIIKNVLKVHFCNKKAPKTEVSDAFWSCWADSNRRPHPYPKALLLFSEYPFMSGNPPESLATQVVRGFLFPELCYLLFSYFRPFYSVVSYQPLYLGLHRMCRMVSTLKGPPLRLVNPSSYSAWEMRRMPICRLA